MLLYSCAQSENLTIVDFLIEQYYNKQPEPLKNETDLKIILEQVLTNLQKALPLEISLMSHLLKIGRRKLST
jgi:mRNA-degrading endonuclease YafQ of YafQ-DinJ toxin-antitoxin module